jgi:hypothetical protein
VPSKGIEIATTSPYKTMDKIEKINTTFRDHIFSLMRPTPDTKPIAGRTEPNITMKEVMMPEPALILEAVFVMIRISEII